MATSDSSGVLNTSVSSELFAAAPAVQDSTSSINDGASPDSAGVGASSTSSAVPGPSVLRERERDRGYPERHRINTVSPSPMRTRAAPATPRRSRNDTDDLKSEVRELTRRLRLSENQATHLVQRAVENAAAVRYEEEELRASYMQWGAQANSEINALLNSFQMSTTSDQMREQQVQRLESQLQYVEGSAAETRGRHDELHRTTLAVFAAEEMLPMLDSSTKSMLAARRQ